MPQALGRVLERLNLENVPLRRRAYQAANASIVAVAGKFLGISHVIEYPKCGGSWISNMLRTYVGVSFNDGYRLVRPRDVIQKHASYRWDFWRPIVVVRDPRDMYVSCYYHETSYSERERSLAISRYFQSDSRRTLHEDFAAYLEAKLLHITHPRYFLCDFLDSWLSRPNVCIVRYEDCLEEPEGQLIRMVRFCGLPVSLDAIAHAAKANSFATVTERLYGERREAGAADNRRFVRKGVAGDWRNHFNARSCEVLERFEGSSLRRLGYEADRGWIASYLSSLST